MSSSFRTSSISRNDMCVLTSFISYLTMRPGIRRVLLPPDVKSDSHLLVAPLRRVHVVEGQRFLVQHGLGVRARDIPRRRRRRSCSSSRCASPSGSDTPRGNGRRRIRCAAARRGTSARRVRGSRRRGRPFPAPDSCRRCHRARSRSARTLRAAPECCRARSASPRRCGPCRSSPT